MLVKVLDIFVKISQIFSNLSSDFGVFDELSISTISPIRLKTPFKQILLFC